MKKGKPKIDPSRLLAFETYLNKIYSDNFTRENAKEAFPDVSPKDVSWYYNKQILGSLLRKSDPKQFYYQFTSHYPKKNEKRKRNNAPIAEDSKKKNANSNTVNPQTERKAASEEKN